MEFYKRHSSGTAWSSENLLHTSGGVRAFALRFAFSLEITNVKFPMSNLWL